MTQMTSLSQMEEQVAFVTKVKADFEAHPKRQSFGGCAPGSFLALRWGMGDDCILLLKLDEYFEPVNYQQAIKKGRE